MTETPGDALHLARWTASSGSNVRSRGAVVIASGDHEWRASADGIGAIDALYRAVDKALAGVLTGHPRLLAYDIHALGEGTDTIGAVTVRIAPPDIGGERGSGEYTGVASGPNIIAASIEAYIIGPQRGARRGPLVGRDRGRRQPQGRRGLGRQGARAAGRSRRGRGPARHDGLVRAVDRPAGGGFGRRPAPAPAWPAARRSPARPPAQRWIFGSVIETRPCTLAGPAISSDVGGGHARRPPFSLPSRISAPLAFLRPAGRPSAPLDSGTMTTDPPIAYAGEPGAFAEDAVIAAFGDVPRVSLGSFREVFETVAGGDATAGVVPIENVINGTVRENYDLLLEHDLAIRGEVVVPVRLCLAALPGQRLDDIERVYSHIQALGQAEGSSAAGRGSCSRPTTRRAPGSRSSTAGSAARRPSSRRARRRCSGWRSSPTRSATRRQPDPVHRRRRGGHGGRAGIGNVARHPGRRRLAHDPRLRRPQRAGQPSAGARGIRGARRQPVAARIAAVAVARLGIRLLDRRRRGGR